MSYTLLERLQTHIMDDGGLLDQYRVRFYRWLDQDLKGTDNVVCFSNPNSAGNVDYVVQYPDVRIQLLVGASDVRSGDDDMLGIVQYLRSDFTTGGVFLFNPLGQYTGPIYLQNGRAIFELIVRCGVEDH